MKRLGHLRPGVEVQWGGNDNWAQIWNEESYVALVYRPYAFVLTTEELEADVEAVVGEDVTVVPVLEPFDEERLQVEEDQIDELFEWWHASVDPEKFSPWDLWFATICTRWCRRPVADGFQRRRLTRRRRIRPRSRAAVLASGARILARTRNRAVWIVTRSGVNLTMECSPTVETVVPEAEIVDVATIGGRTLLVLDTDGKEPFPGDLARVGESLFEITGVEMGSPDADARDRYGVLVRRVEGGRNLEVGERLTLISSPESGDV